MGKGEELEKLLDKGDVIQKQMDSIFIQYNVKYLDLKNLPQEGIEEWDRLFKQKDEINTEIGKLFNCNIKRNERN